MDGQPLGCHGFHYTLAYADEGKTIDVEVSFTDNAGNEEMLTNAAMAEPPTANLENTPHSHDGEGVFIFALRFSEEVSLGYCHRAGTPSPYRQIHL